MLQVFTNGHAIVVKRLTALIYVIYSLTPAMPVGTFFVRWSQHWVQNQSTILKLTAINTSITFSTEVVTRTVLSRGRFNQKHFKFFAGQGNFFQRINRQSLINIFMTLLASLMGAPVYFFKRRRFRFTFFLSFGVFLSVFAQGLVGLIKDGSLALHINRLLFDISYCATLKFTLFEFFRRPILKAKFLRMFYLRGKQDILTSFIRNFLLNLFNLRG